MRKNWKKRLLPILIPVLLVLSVLTYTKVTINAEVNEKTIYVTAKEIPPRTEITEDMIVPHSMPSRGIPLNAVTKKEDIVGKWTVAGFGLSASSYIYADKIVNQEELPDAGLLALEEGEIAVPLLVDLETSLGNSIIPDSHVDLYFRNVLYDKNDPKAIFGPITENIRVVAVKDSQATNVYDNEGIVDNTKNRDMTKTKSTTLAKIYIFAVPEELGKLVEKGKMLGEVIPVATGHSYKNDLEVVSSENEVVEYLKKATYQKTINTEKGIGEKDGANN